MATKRRRKPIQTGKTDEKIQLSGFPHKWASHDNLCWCYAKIIYEEHYHVQICVQDQAQNNFEPAVCWAALGPSNDLSFDSNLESSPPVGAWRWLRLGRWVLLVRICWQQMWSLSYQPKRASQNHSKNKKKEQAKLKIPLRNTKEMFSQVDDDKDLIFYTKGTRKRENLVRLESRVYDHRYEIVNSCNGLYFAWPNRRAGILLLFATPSFIFQNLVILGVGFATHVSVGLAFQSKEQSMQGDEDICLVDKE